VKNVHNKRKGKTDIGVFVTKLQNIKWKRRYLLHNLEMTANVGIQATVRNKATLQNDNLRTTKWNK
jgi:hypothetical protein